MKSHCIRGHALAGDNLYVNPSGDRFCRICKRMSRVGRMPAVSLESRFWAKVERSEGCWRWTASLDGKGYGQFKRPNESRMVRAHRLAYELEVGPIPDGLHLDHLCRNRACVNPAHLEPVTPAENLRRRFDPPGLPASTVIEDGCPGHQAEANRTAPAA